MIPMRVCLGAGLLAVLFCFTQPAAADTYPIILRGTVVMEDGSPPPFTLAVERICSDNMGSAPGPITNKKGEYTWRMEIDPLATRACYIRATHAGYVSNTVEVQGLDTTRTSITLPPLMITVSAADPYAIIVAASSIPSRAKSAWDAAMKALDEPNFPEAGRQLRAAVSGSQKYSQGWHALGVVSERLKKPAEARDAYEHAIQSDPKLLPPYITLARLCIKTKDWQCTSTTADALIKADVKRAYPEIYLHQAVARYQLKDLDGALAAVQEAIRLDPKYKKPRTEYVLGRILEAKGDAAGAREHMSKYLELEPAAGDVELVKGHLQLLGKPEAGSVEPELEPL